jgi:hypothetical protein
VKAVAGRVFRDALDSKLSAGKIQGGKISPEIHIDYGRKGMLE